MTALLVTALVLLGLLSLVCIAGFIVLVMIHAKVAAYHHLNGDCPPAP